MQLLLYKVDFSSNKSCQSSRRALTGRMLRTAVTSLLFPSALAEEVPKSCNFLSFAHWLSRNQNHAMGKKGLASIERNETHITKNNQTCTDRMNLTGYSTHGFFPTE